MLFSRIIFLLTCAILSGCSADSEADVNSKPESKTVQLNSNTENPHPLQIGKIAAKQSFDQDKKFPHTIGTPYLGPNLHPAVTKDFGFVFAGKKSKPDLLKGVVEADVLIASPGKSKNIFSKMIDSDGAIIKHQGIEDDFVVLDMNKTNFKADTHMDLYSEIGHHSIGAISINAVDMTPQKLELKNNLRVGVMTMLGNCTIYPESSSNDADTIYSKAFYLGEKASLFGSSKEKNITSLKDIKAFRDNDRHKLMKLESLSHHYPDDLLGQAVNNAALKYLDFYGVSQNLINNKDTFWINGKIVGEVNLLGGAQLFTTNYMEVDLSSKDGRKTVDYSVSKPDFFYIDDIIVEDGMVHLSHTTPMLGNKLFLKDNSQFYLRTSTQFVHQVSENPNVYDEMKTDFMNVLKKNKPKNVERKSYRGNDGKNYEHYHLNLGHKYAMYMEHIVLHGQHKKVFKLDSKGSQIDFFGNRDGKWDLGNGAFYIPLIFVEDNSLAILEHYKDHEDKILVLGVDDKASEIAHARLRLYHEALGHDMVILMQVKGEKDPSSGLALHMAQKLHGGMPAKDFYSMVENVDPISLGAAAQIEISNLQDLNCITQQSFLHELMCDNKLKISSVKFGQSRQTMISAQKSSYRVGALYSNSPKANYAGLMAGKTLGNTALLLKIGGAFSNSKSDKVSLSRSQFNVDALLTQKIMLGGVSLMPSVTLGVECFKNGAFRTRVPLGGGVVPFTVQANKNTALNIGASCGLSSYDNQLKLVAGIKASYKEKKGHHCVLGDKQINLQSLKNEVTPYLAYDFSINGVIANLNISANQLMLGIGASL